MVDRPSSKSSFSRYFPRHLISACPLLSHCQRLGADKKYPLPQVSPHIRLQLFSLTSFHSIAHPSIDTTPSSPARFTSIEYRVTETSVQPTVDHRISIKTRKETSYSNVHPYHQSICINEKPFIICTNQYFKSALGKEGDGPSSSSSSHEAYEVCL